jgi:anaerobic ribonucleoside-triphosphate reductase activating protein
MPEITWLIDEVTGALTLEGLSGREAAQLAGDLLSPAIAVNCARPVNVAPLVITRAEKLPAPSSAEPQLHLYRIYHGSLTDGPGRRSVAQTVHCTRNCPGCYVPQTHNINNGVALTVSEVVARLLDPIGGPRDGVTILGGEPFLQPVGLAALLHELKARGQHVTVYSGYTLEELRARPEAAVHDALRHTDLLIDGPFVAALTNGAGEWRGSTNQRFIEYPAEALL